MKKISDTEGSVSVCNHPHVSHESRDITPITTNYT